MASALPETTIVVTLPWSASTRTLMSGLPSALHLAWRAGRSTSAWTVPFWTAMFLPHASSGLMPFGLPLGATHWVPALK